MKLFGNKQANEPKSQAELLYELQTTQGTPLPNQRRRFVGIPALFLYVRFQRGHSGA